MALLLGRLWMRKFCLQLVTILAWALHFGSSAHGEEAWRILETPRFSIVSQIGEEDTRDWANQFNEYIEALKKVLRVDEQLLSRLTVVLFARNKSFQPYLPLRPMENPAITQVFLAVTKPGPSSEWPKVIMTKRPVTSFFMKAYIG